MDLEAVARIGHLKSVDDFRAHVATLGLDLPCDDEIQTAPDSPLATPCESNRDHRRFAAEP